MKRPNIVFIMADQLPAAFLGCYGSGVDSTPMLDRLAEKGIRFDRCYATSPVCAPNRATIITGRSPVYHGVVLNNMTLQNDMPLYTHLLREDGYRLGGFGKFHLYPMQSNRIDNLRHLGFHESVETDDTKWGDYIEWIEKEHPEYFKTALSMCWPHKNSENFGRNERDISTDYNKAVEEIINPLKETSDYDLMYSSPLPMELHQTTFITNTSLEFMDSHIKNHSNRPFYCHISYVDPHDPYDPPKPYDTMYKPEDMPEPLPAGWKKHGNPILENNNYNFMQFHKISNNKKAIKKMRALYHGSLRFIDDQISRVVKFLEEKNLFDNTILVFTTDHGEMMGDHNLIAKGIKHYDKGIRCPLIAYGKDIIPNVSNRLTCSLDFYPTICDLAGVDEGDRPPLEGISFAPTCFEKKENMEWEEILISFNMLSSIVTKDRWRLSIYDKYDNLGEMYNLKSDPDEQNNLYYDSKYSDKRQNLMECMIRSYNRRERVPHYRTLPVVKGEKRHIINDGPSGNPIPLYDLPKAPDFK